MHEAGLGSSILYVDLANEFPIPLYNPYVYSDGVRAMTASRNDPALRNWMADAIAPVRDRHPEHDYCFSFASELTKPDGQDVTALDFLELHLWMTHVEVVNLIGELVRR